MCDFKRRGEGMNGSREEMPDGRKSTILSGAVPGWGSHLDSLASRRFLILGTTGPIQAPFTLSGISLKMPVDARE